MQCRSPIPRFSGPPEPHHQQAVGWEPGIWEGVGAVSPGVLAEAAPLLGSNTQAFGNHRWSFPPRPDRHRQVGETEAPSLKPLLPVERHPRAIAVISSSAEHAFSKPIHLRRAYFSLTEILASAWLLVGVARSHRGEWHNRWLRYRAVAEQIRCVACSDLARANPVHAPGGYSWGSSFI